MQTKLQGNSKQYMDAKKKKKTCMQKFHAPFFLSHITNIKLTYLHISHNLTSAKETHQKTVVNSFSILLLNYIIY